MTNAPANCLRRLFRCSEALLCLLFLMAGVAGMADPPPVLRIKKLPDRAAAPKRLNRGQSYESAFRRWGVEGWWIVTTTRENSYESTRAGSGLVVAYMSPDMIAGYTNREAKAQKLNSEEAQGLYEENLKRYSGDHIAFIGYVQIDQNAYVRIDPIDSDWMFTLDIAFGKRYHPAQLVLSPLHYHDISLEGTTLQRRSVLVVFDNLNPDTNQPLLTPDTTAITLSLSGIPGAIRIRFVFPPPKKRA